MQCRENTARTPQAPVSDLPVPTLLKPDIGRVSRCFLGGVSSSPVLVDQGSGQVGTPIGLTRFRFIEDSEAMVAVEAVSSAPQPRQADRKDKRGIVAESRTA